MNRDENLSSKKRIDIFMSKDKKLEKAGIYASFVILLVKETGIKCDWKTKLSSDGNSVDFFYTFYIRNALTHQVKELPHCIPDVENSDLFEVSREIDETFREYKNKYMKNGISLKPCPFCGGEAAIDTVIKPDGGCHYEVKLVKCLKCGAKTKEKITDGYYGDYCSDEEIAELWNRRVVKGD